MNRGEAVAEMRLRLGFYDKKLSDFQNQLVVSQRRLENGVKLPTTQGRRAMGIFMPWFLVSEIQTAVTQIGEDRVPFPTPIAGVHNGFLSEVEDAALWILDPDAEATDPWIELTKDHFDVIQQQYPGSGMPKAYDAMGTYFRLRHIPNAVYTLKIITHNADLVPTTDSGTNKWLTYAPEVLWGHAGLSMATALRDAFAIKQFTDVFNEGVEALWLRTEERSHTNRRIVMGGRD